MFLRFAYPSVIITLIPILAISVIYKILIYKYPKYTFPLISCLSSHKTLGSTIHKKILFVLRTLILFGLIFLIARPQWVDERSKVNINGVDIILALDVSFSMTFFDDLKDQRSRITVAKEEAIRFIDKRIDDPIGIVLFGGEALSRCPLTNDKSLLKDLVGNLKIGDINHNATWLGTGLATAVNRLRHSKAKSKVIILLTDGQPTPPEKIDIETAITLAKQFGIKVYTVGIGSEQGGYLQHPLFGVQKIQEDALNITLLQKIADQTGGKFFRASNPKQMREIYDTIDSLEKTEYQTTLFSKYYEAFLTLLWVIIGLLGTELFLKLFIWRGV
jgi:Ca-activated chloride channel family protein